MPNYNYICRTCNHVWEQQVLIADRDKPTTEPCPNPECVNLDTPEGARRAMTNPPPIIERIIAAPGVSYTIYDRRKVPEAFKDVLRRIKAQNHGSVIDV